MRLCIRENLARQNNTRRCVPNAAKSSCFPTSRQKERWWSVANVPRCTGEGPGISFHLFLFRRPHYSRSSPVAGATCTADATASAAAARHPGFAPGYPLSRHASWVHPESSLRKCVLFLFPEPVRRINRIMLPRRRAGFHCVPMMTSSNRREPIMGGAGGGRVVRQPAVSSPAWHPQPGKPNRAKKIRRILFYRSKRMNRNDFRPCPRR